MRADCEINFQTCRGRPDHRDTSVDGTRTLLEVFIPSVLLPRVSCQGTRINYRIAILYVCTIWGGYHLAWV